VNAFPRVKPMKRGQMTREGSPLVFNRSPPVVLHFPREIRASWPTSIIRGNEMNCAVLPSVKQCELELSGLDVWERWLQAHFYIIARLN
jgi:hypothetical protein